MRWVLVLALAFAGDAPEISRSVGKKGGIVVLWPRVNAAEGVDSGTAGRVQAALAEVAKGLATDVDVRPEPERVCPKPDGCKATAIGVSIASREGGCVLVATVSAPGPSVQTLVPWFGGVELKEPTAPFREPPEGRMIITDYGRCTDIEAAIRTNREGIVRAAQAAMRSGE